MTDLGADLTNLFRAPAASSPFRQGRIVSFNSATGANTVEVAGAVLTNLALLNSGEAVLYQPGDAVILVKYAASWAILGRIFVPGASKLASAAVEFATLNQYADNFSLSTTDAVKASGTVTVPSWANQVFAIVVGLCGAVNSRAAADILQAYVMVDGVQLSVPYMTAAVGASVAVTPSFARAYSVAPGGTITVQLKASTSGGAWAANTANRAALVGAFIFRKA